MLFVHLNYWWRARDMVDWGGSGHAAAGSDDSCGRFVTPSKKRRRGGSATSPGAGSSTACPSPAMSGVKDEDEDEADNDMEDEFGPRRVGPGETRVQGSEVGQDGALLGLQTGVLEQCLLVGGCGCSPMGLSERPWCMVQRVPFLLEDFVFARAFPDTFRPLDPDGHEQPEVPDALAGTP